MKPWLIETAATGSPRLILAQPRFSESSDVEEVSTFRDVLLLNGIADAMITVPNGSCFCLQGGYLLNIDYDPAEYLPNLPRWPFNEFRKEPIK